MSGDVGNLWKERESDESLGRGEKEGNDGEAELVCIGTRTRERGTRKEEEYA